MSSRNCIRFPPITILLILSLHGLVNGEENPLEFISEVRNVTATVGDNTKLECLISVPNERKIFLAWFFKGSAIITVQSVVIARDQHYDVSITQDNYGQGVTHHNATLFIKDVQMEHGGPYYCQTNQEKSDTFHKEVHNLNVIPGCQDAFQRCLSDLLLLPLSSANTRKRNVCNRFVCGTTCTKEYQRYCKKDKRLTWKETDRFYNYLCDVVEFNSTISELSICASDTYSDLGDCYSKFDMQLEFQNESEYQKCVLENVKYKCSHQRIAFVERVLDIKESCEAYYEAFRAVETKEYEIMLYASVSIQRGKFTFILMGIVVFYYCCF